MKIVNVSSGLFVCHLLVSFSLIFPSGISSAEDLNPGRPAFEEAVGLKNNGQLLEAEKKFKEALQLEPANPDYHFELANVYAARFDILRKSRAEEKTKEMLALASDQLSQTVMLRPEHIPAHYNLGVLYKRAGRFEEAREQFKKVLALDPNSVNAIMQIGAVYEEQGFFDEARDYYQKAKTMNYGNPDIEGALEDLKNHEAQAHQHTLNQKPFLMNSQVISSAQDQVMNSSKIGNPPQQNIQQALPYLGSMLIQEFMKRREKSSE